MPAAAPTAIVPIRPVSDSDPALQAFEGRPLLPEVLRGLRGQGHVGRVVLSMSDRVPEGTRERLAGWGFDSHVSASDLPQVRLGEVFERDGLDAAVVLTPYGMFMDGPLMDEAWAMVSGGEADAAWPKDVIAAKFFAVVNAEAARALARTRSYPVSPFAFPGRLGKTDLRTHAFTGLESPAEQFLWELLYAGQRSMPPADLVGPWLDSVGPKRRHRRDEVRALLRRAHGLDDWGDLEAPLARLAAFESVKRLAMMVNALPRIRPHVPAGKRFLEIGYGKTPLCSCQLARIFASGVAVEPFKHDADALEASLDFCEFLARRHPTLLWPVEGSGAPGGFRDRVAFHQTFLEDVALPDKSMDFCVSRMVFEHVMDPEGLSREMRRVLRPGGVMLHEIGFNDHDDLSSVNFEFLRHSREQWAAMGKSTNLWRVNDFAELWRSMGFEVEIPWREQRRVPPSSLHPSWDGYAEDDLYCYVALMRAVRPV